MSVDLIRYDLLVQDALRNVVRRVLTDAARDGLPGEHHFFIGFDTTAPGVRLSARLKERHPKTMTIVLQHQFWDLIVTDKFIEVGLSFGNVPERLHIPFEALTSFYDPSVKFGLQFEQPASEEEDEASEDAAPSPAPTGPVPVRPRTTSVPATNPTPRPARLAEAKPEASAPVAKPATAKPAERAKTPVREATAKDVPTKDVQAKDVPAKEPAAKDAAKQTPAKEEATAAKEEAGSGGAQVVRLDAFRKK